jgi:hypothetical protein
MRRCFLDVVQFRLSNGSIHAFALEPDDCRRFRDCDDDDVFVSKGAMRWRDRLPCEFALRLRDVEYMRYLREPALRDDNGAVHVNSVPIDHEDREIRPEDEDDRIGGHVYAYFRGSGDPLVAAVLADRAYLVNTDDAEEPGQFQLILDLFRAGLIESDRYDFDDSDGEAVVLCATHLSLLIVPAKIVDLTPNAELDELARAAFDAGQRSLRDGWPGRQRSGGLTPWQDCHKFMAVLPRRLYGVV